MSCSGLLQAVDDDDDTSWDLGLDLTVIILFFVILKVASQVNVDYCANVDSKYAQVCMIKVFI